MKNSTDTKQIKELLNEAGKTAIHMLMLDSRLGRVSQREQENYQIIFFNIFEASKLAGWDMDFGYAKGHAEGIYNRYMAHRKFKALKWDLKNCKPSKEDRQKINQELAEIKTHYNF